MRGAEGPRKILFPMPSDTERGKQCRRWSWETLMGQGGLEMGESSRDRRKMAGAGGGGVWSPSS